MKFGNKEDKHPLSINILKYQYYNYEFFNCQEIVLYETLIVLGGLSFGSKQEFFHSTETLAGKTGIKRHSIDMALKKFKDLRFIDYNVRGMPQVKYISIIWDNILEMLPEIYQFDKVREYFDGSTKPLIDFYQQLAENNKKITENNKQKNIKKNNIKEDEKENEKENIVIALSKFRQYLYNFFNGKQTVRSEFNERDFHEAMEIYNYEEIIDAVPYDIDGYFNDRRDMRTFFNKNDEGKIQFIEKRISEREEENERIINRFKEIMASRIRYFNEKNAPVYKPEISLNIYESSISKIKKVFEEKDQEDVFNAFIVFCDEFLQGKINIKHDVLGYFLKEENGNYPIVNDYQILYLGSYTSTKDW